MRKLILLCLVSFFFTGCAAGLARLSVNEVSGWRTDNVRLNSIDGTLTVEIENKNKKDVIFESCRIILSHENDQLMIADLLTGTYAPPGLSQVTLPVRARFSRTNIARSIAKRFTGERIEGKVLVDVTITARKEGDRKSRTIHVKKRMEAEKLVSMAGKMAPLLRLALE